MGMLVGKDSLNEELRDRQKQASRFITLSAKLIAPSLDAKVCRPHPSIPPSLPPSLHSALASLPSGWV